MAKKAISILLVISILFTFGALISVGAETNEYVSDAYYNVFHTQKGGYTLTCRLPKILLDSEDARIANQEIIIRFSNSLSENQAAQDGQPFENIHEISYEYFVNNDILSLVIKDSFVATTSIREYSVYNFNLISKKRIDRNTLLQTNRLSWEKIQDKIKEIYHNNLPYENYVGTTNYNTVKSYYDESIKAENIDKTEIFFGSNKSVKAICYWKSLAGSGPNRFRYDIYTLEGDIESNSNSIEPFFKLGIDTNQFTHYGTSYYITNKYYRDKLYWDSLNTWDSTFRIHHYIHSGETDGGVCHGIALSMCYAKNGDLDLNYLNNNKITDNYWDLGSLYDSNSSDKTRFRDLVVYYHLSQLTANGSESYSVSKNEWSTKSLSQRLSDFLRKLKNEAERAQNEEKAFVFSFKYKHGNEPTEGHSVVVCGYKFNNSTNNHEVLIYDENSYDDDNPSNLKYCTLRIPSDFSTFYFTDALGEKYHYNISDIWTQLEVYGIEKLYGGNAFSSISILKGNETVSANSTTELCISAFKKFKVTNESGQFLEYDGQNYTGNMTVYNCKLVDNCDGSFSWKLTIDASMKFAFSNVEKDCQVLGETYSGGFYIVSDNSSSFTIDGKTIELNGNNYNFDIALQTDGQKDYVRVQGSAIGNALFADNDETINLLSDNVITDISVVSYEKDKVVYDSEENNVSSLTIDDESGKIISQEIKNFFLGDVNLDGTVSISDATEVQKHLAEYINLNDTQTTIADTNGDGNVTISDATELQKYLAEFIDHFGQTENTSISLNTSHLYMSIGEKKTLTANVNPSVDSSKIEWVSNNETVATITNGVIEAKSIGSATIIASYNGKTAQCVVTVTPIEASSVSLNKSNLSLIVGNTYQLSATINPSNTTNKAVTWSCNYPNIATVDSYGMITAKGVGSATVTVKTNNGKTAQCMVTVYPILPESVKISNEHKEVDVGESFTLSAMVYPNNATNKTLTWSSSDSSIATVSQSGVVKTIHNGITTISATTTNGKKSSCVLIVYTPISGAQSLSLFMSREPNGYARLTKDFSVDLLPLCNDEFMGCLNGDNHTITYSYTASTNNATSDVCKALIAKTNGAIIQNIKTAGSIDHTVSSDSFCGNCCAGLVANAQNTVFENCKNTANIKGAFWGSDSAYGLTGGITAFSNNCVFIGCSNSGQLESFTNANKESISVIGGISGQSVNSQYYTCNNTGTLFSKAFLDDRENQIICSACSGGISGVVENSILDHCVCNGTSGATIWSMGTTQIDSFAASGGLAGIGNAAFTDCSSNSELFSRVNGKGKAYENNTLALEK